MLATFPGDDFLGTTLKFRKRKKISSSLVYVLHKTWKKRGIFMWLSCRNGKEMYKKARCTCKLVFLLNKAIAVLTFLLPSLLLLLKLPGERAILLTKFFPFQGESDPRSWVCNNILGSFRWIKRWCWNCSKPFGWKHKLHKVCIFTPKLWIEGF